MRTPLLTTSEKMANLQPAVIDRRYSLRLVDFLVLVFLVHVLDVVL